MSSFAAFGVGLATRATSSGRILDTWFPHIAQADDAQGHRALAEAVGHEGGGASHEIKHRTLERLEAAGDDRVARVARHLATAQQADTPTRTVRFPVATFVADLAAPPIDPHDVYLRLHLLSSRRVAPHGMNLDGVFGLLNNVVWTDLGPCEPAGFEDLRLELAASGHPLRVTSVDKFPRMTDYVVPSGVRIGDADRVRLGAHLAPGTTVMHEGFVNYNAGTLGASMVEGRVSAGVVVGDGSDVGGGASIMGTLSGGGTEVIRIGENCLIGANAGLGISLGDRCVVEAGLYLTAGAKVTLPDGVVVKASELSGRDGLLFRRDSRTGRVSALPRVAGTAEWGGLNAQLHAND